MGVHPYNPLTPDIALGVFFVPEIVERVMGIEPTTTCLGSKYSTTELHPRFVPVLCQFCA